MYIVRCHCTCTVIYSGSHKHTSICVLICMCASRSDTTNRGLPSFSRLRRLPYNTSDGGSTNGLKITRYIQAGLCMFICNQTTPPLTETVSCYSNTCTRNRTKKLTAHTRTRHSTPSTEFLREFSIKLLHACA